MRIALLFDEATNTEIGKMADKYGQDNMVECLKDIQVNRENVSTACANHGIPESEFRNIILKNIKCMRAVED